MYPHGVFMTRSPLFVTLLLLLAVPSLAADGKERVKTTKFEVENGMLKLPGPVVFAAGSDKLAEESDQVLWVIADYLEAKKYVTLLRIEGHTDNAGKSDANQELSEKRAMAVARWLVSKGADCKRLIAVGFGDTKPVESNDTPAGKATNRRIVVAPAALRGKLIGSGPADGGGKVAGDVCEKGK